MLHQIGVGALGPVFRTYEPTRDRLVAVKVFRLDVTPEQARALADELGRATEAGLFHPSIVEPVAAGLEGTVAYRAEEYVAAESLDVAMRHYAPAPLDTALPFITQLANAIDIARAAGVGHGALHPRDIFVTPDEARATGFGVVDALERLGLRAPVRRPYSAPERIAGHAWSTPADVYSLGAIAFELLTGRRPSGPGEQNGSLNPSALGPHADAIRAVLARAMAEDPAARYATAGAFASALTEAAQGAVSPAPIAPVPPVEPVAAPAPSSDDASIIEPVDIIEEEDEAPGLSVAAAESLDVFAADPPGSTESPREAARKAIAARKRQAKPKPAVVEPAALDPDAESTRTDGTPEPVKVESVKEEAALLHDDTLPPAELEPPPDAAAASLAVAPTVASVEPALVRVEAPATDAASLPVEETSSLASEPAVNEVIARDAERPRPPASPRSRATREREERPEPVATLADVDLWHLDPIMKGPDVSPIDVEPEMPAVAAALRDADLAATLPDRTQGSASDDGDAHLDAPLRESSDRVVAVDEFRARESAVRSEKTWPRPSDRPMPSIAPVSRGVPPPPSKLLETNDVSLVQTDEPPEPEAQRFAMMPIAIGLLLGLLLGYGGGYFVGWRRGAADTTTQFAQNAAAQQLADGTTPTSSLSTPGTSGQSRDYSDQSVTPAAGRGTGTPAQPNPAQRAPSSSSAAAAAPPAGASGGAAKANPPATMASPVSAPPKPAPSSAAPSKPRPASPAPAAARTSGTILVKSSPSRAAVTVNGRWTGRTPLTLENREFGEYVIRVVEPGYDVAREVFRLSAGAPSKTIDVTLKPSGGAKRPAAAPEAQPAATAGDAPAKAGAGATGGLFVDSRPQGAKVIVNGKAVGVTPVRLSDQPVGAYEVRLELADHQPWTATARVVGGGTARVTGSMERIR